MHACTHTHNPNVKSSFPNPGNSITQQTSTYVFSMPDYTNKSYLFHIGTAFSETTRISNKGKDSVPLNIQLLQNLALSMDCVV